MTKLLDSMRMGCAWTVITGRSVLAPCPRPSRPPPPALRHLLTATQGERCRPRHRCRSEHVLPG